MRTTTLTAVAAIVQADPPKNRVDRDTLLRTLGFIEEPAKEQPAEKLLSFGDAAKRIGRSKAVVHLLAKRGVLKKVLFPGGVRCAGVLASDVDRFLKSATGEAVA